MQSLGFSEPSEAEKRRYFRGLAGRPRLVARTSTTLWDGGEWASEPKRMAALGEHPLVHHWNAELRGRIIDELTNGRAEGLDWQACFPIRIGGRDDIDTSTHPVVVLVTLAGDARPCAWDAAMRVALRCRGVVRAAGPLDDVEVEIVQCHLARMASPASAATARRVDWSFSQVPSDSCDSERDLILGQTNAALMSLLPFPGCRIEQPAARPGEPEAAAGTLGLFLRLREKATASQALDAEDGGRQKGGIYCLTDRHVAVGQRESADKDLWHHDRHNDSGDGNTPLQMLTGGPSCAPEIGKLLWHQLANLRCFSPRIQRRYLHDSANTEKATAFRMHADCTQYTQDLRDTLDTFLPADESTRIVGPVVHSPGYSVSEHGHLVTGR